MMTTCPLAWKENHLFVELDGNLWLYDTGAPASFGTDPEIRIDGQSFHPSDQYLGLTPSLLSSYIGIPCQGLLGTDILGRFDHLIDTTTSRLHISSDELSHSGTAIPLDECLGVPIVNTSIGGTDCRMFFDTGASVSYWQDDSLADHPQAGRYQDFFPGMGQFETETYRVDCSLGGVSFTLRCGSLPGLLGASLMMAGTQGILGNQVLNQRVVGYFPRRNILFL